MGRGIIEIDSSKRNGDEVIEIIEKKRVFKREEIDRIDR